VTADLVLFLWARLDEDEQAARAASAGPWEPVGMGGVTGVYATTTGGMVALADQTSDPERAPDAQHIARHHPARVLAESTALRGLLAYAAEHQDEVGGLLAAWAAAYADHPDYPAGQADRAG
jgi:hypothetical protein